MGIIESENKEQALLVVPPNLRSNTRVVKLVSYDRSSAEAARFILMDKVSKSLRQGSALGEGGIGFH